jgi:3-oxoacyl-[acyl-carrier-protein] synthase II
MARVMELALADAGLPPSAVGYVSAHGTATDVGDIAETHATAKVLGTRIPISSMKGFLGHTLGACGAIEAWWGIEMLNQGWFAPTANLRRVDSACADADYLTGQGRSMDLEYIMSNNFAFGGVNTSLIFRRK